MKQLSLTQSATGFEVSSKRTRKREFLEQMNAVIPWSSLAKVVEPHYPKGLMGRSPMPLEVMLRVHFMQQWFGLSDPAMEEALHDVPVYREFITLDSGEVQIPDESTILRFRHLLERHKLSAVFLSTVNGLLQSKGYLLRAGTSIDATLIAAPPSTKNQSKSRDPEMHSTQKGGNYYFGMKAHIGTDVESGLVHTVTTTAANAHDVTEAHKLLHGDETAVFGDSGYRGLEKRDEMVEVMAEKSLQKQDDSNQALPIDREEMIAKAQSLLHISKMYSKRKKHDLNTELGQAMEAYEKIKSKIRAKVEHAFRILKCQFGFRKVRYKGLSKNTAQINTLFMLANVYMLRKKLSQSVEWYA
jgi:transposase, IS5 family